MLDQVNDMKKMDASGLQTTRMRNENDQPSGIMTE